MALDPRRVLIFRAVARKGSVSGGARQLGWTQPAVSQHLRALEAQVGTALLLRGPTGVSLTQAGERLLQRADAIAGELGLAESELEELADGGGAVTMAAFPSAMADLVPRVIARLAESAPQLHVRVVELEPPEALAAVASNDVDLAVVFEYAETGDDDGLASHPLGDDPTLVVLPDDHELADATSIAMTQLAHERWIAGCPRCRTHLETLATQAGFEPDIRHSTDDIVAAQAFVACTRGVALVQAMALAAHRRTGLAVVPLADGSSRAVSVRHRPGADRVPAVESVVQALQAVRAAA